MLETQRLLILPLETKHLEPLRKMRNDFTTWHWLTSVTPIMPPTQIDWFYNLAKDNLRLYLAIEEKKTEDFVGLLRSDEWDRINRSVRIGVDVAPGHRGKGYGTEAFLTFIDYLFEQQNFHRIWFLVSEANDQARKLYEKVGFKQEGKQREAIFRDGKYWDYISMSLLEAEWRKRKK